MDSAIRPPPLSTGSVEFEFEIRIATWKMTVDPTTVYWMVEFVLRQRTISDEVASALFLALPFPSASASASASAPPSVRRAILLRGLSSDLSRPGFSPRTLRLIELLQIQNPRPNPLASDAYLSVATYIVSSAPDFASAVSSLFLRRIGEILKFPDASGLASNRMKTVAEEMATALTDPVLRAEIVGRNSLKEAMEAVRAFLEEEREEMELQPCFLETAAAQSQIMAQIKAAATLKSISTPEVTKLVKDLRSRCAELKEMVEDPLPEAIKFAKEVAESYQAKAGGNEIDIPVDKGVPENCKGKDVISTGMPKQSLMDRQPTTFHYEWTETAEVTSDISEGSPRRFHLASPKRIAVSPLMQVAKKKLGARRKKKKWSVLEEDTLRNAVEEFGRGNWKQMLVHHRYIFEERTEIDLKDKWRNMTRS